MHRIGENLLLTWLFFSEALGLTYFVENAFILHVDDRNDEISIMAFFSSKNLNQYI